MEKNELVFLNENYPIDCFNCGNFATGNDNMLHQFAESLGSAIDAKDPHTRTHSEEVAEISFDIALAMGLCDRDAEIIHVAGHLHDIGKIGIPDCILKKEGALSEEEWLEIKKHPDIGASILKPVDCLVTYGIVDMVRGHHERYDGKGYPDGKKKDEILLGARIISLADSLSAMLQDRPYRKAMNFDSAVKEIGRCSGDQFDPSVVEAFLKIQKVVFSYFIRINKT